MLKRFDMSINDLVTITTTQTNPYQSYNSSPCNCFVCPAGSTGLCSNGDWNYSTLSCCGGLCGSISQCSKIDSSICPKIGNSPPISTSWTFPDQMGATGAKINCKYNANKFINTSDILTWLKYEGHDLNYNTKIMPQFCSAKVTTCPIDISGIKMTSCNRMLSTAEDGNLCRSWEKDNPKLADEIMIKYCSTPPNNNFGCDCISGSATNTYQIASKYIKAPIGCWFRPCQSPNNELILSTDKNPVCPADTCVPLSAITPAQKSLINPAEISCPLPLLEISKNTKNYKITNTHLTWISVVLVIILFVLILAIISIVFFNP